MAFEFETDDRALEFCGEIIREMKRAFSIPEEEAIGRLNRHWQGQRIVGQDVLYHEDPEFWARCVYYENDADWWQVGANPVPKPYP